MRKNLLLLFILFYQVASAQTAWVNAGPNQTISAGQTASLIGTSFNVPQVKWLTNGTGTFTYQYALQTVYNPSTSDILAGGVTLTLRDRFNATIKDKMKLKIIRDCPTVDIIPTSDIICGYDEGGEYSLTANTTGYGFMLKWSTPGSGYFDDEYEASTTYWFSEGDAGSGKVWLYVTLTDTIGNCPPVKDSFYLKLNDPARIETISTDENFYCGTEPIQISSILSGTANTIYWTTSGSGIFTPNPSKNPNYFPTLADVQIGYVEFYAVSNDPDGPCPAAIGETIGIEFPFAYINIGNDTTICSDVDGDTLKLNSHPNAFIDSVRWSHNGTGFFNSPTKFFPYYVYTAQDVINGKVEIYCVGYSKCGPYKDTIVLTLNEQPWLEFPTPIVYACRDETTIFASVIIHGDATGGTWTSTGYGVFANPNATTTKYTASLWDTYEGCIQLIFTTNQSSSPCPSAVGHMTVCFQDCKIVDGKHIQAKQNTGIRLSPNPAVDFISIHSAQPLSGIRIEVYDAMGILYHLPPAMNNRLDISSLNPGHYYLILSDSSDHIQRLHFVKQ